MRAYDSHMPKPFAVIAVAAITLTACRHVDPVELMASRLITARVSERPIPVLSSTHPRLDLASAYRVQAAYTRYRLKSDATAGYKAGLTSQAARKQFDVDQPVAGMLFVSGELTGSPVIESGLFWKPMIETEIGFRIAKPITRRLRDVDELRHHVDSVMPVIEFPDLGFVTMKGLTGPDIVAANVCASHFLVGAALDLDLLDVDAVSIALARDGENISRGRATDALGSQWEAARWLVNTALAQGHRIKAGQLLITGALGGMLPARPGSYIADYGELGVIRFAIK